MLTSLKRPEKPSRPVSFQLHERNLAFQSLPNHLHSITLLGRELKLIENLNLFQPIPHPGPLFLPNAPNEVYQIPLFQGISGTDKYAELRVVKNILVWQLDFVADDHRNTVTDYGIKQTVR